MLARLIIIFITVPLVEMVLLIEVGKRIGTANTLLLIVGTGVVGAIMARAQGMGIVRTIGQQLARGEIPAGTVMDGLMILVAAALLLTPGLLTDLAGLSLLLPAVRRVLKDWLRRRVLARFIAGNTILFRRRTGE